MDVVAELKVASTRELVATAATRLEHSGVEMPRLDAELLLATALGVSRPRMIVGGIEPSAAQLAVFASWIERRAAREPVAYITGSKGFRRIELAVDRRVLIPRPETELLVSVVKAGRPCAILDVATGSGAVALALADELPGSALDPGREDGELRGARLDSADDHPRARNPERGGE
ncbi:MAG: hypothetical protein WAO61_05995, partial [Solirubrobacterales bacterium]